jgi:hypothetical protein
MIVRSLCLGHSTAGLHANTDREEPHVLLWKIPLSNSYAEVQTFSCEPRQTAAIRPIPRQHSAQTSISQHQSKQTRFCAEQNSSYAANLQTLLAFSATVTFEGASNRRNPTHSTTGLRANVDFSTPIETDTFFLRMNTIHVQ